MPLCGLLCTWGPEGWDTDGSWVLVIQRREGQHTGVGKSLRDFSAPKDGESGGGGSRL